MDEAAEYGNGNDDDESGDGPTPPDHDDDSDGAALEGRVDGVDAAGEDECEMEEKAEAECR